MNRITALMLRIVCISVLAIGSLQGQGNNDGIITGIIKDRDAGTPIKGMITFPGLDIPGLVSDSAGRYQVKVAPGEYKVHIYANGYRWIERKIKVIAGQTEQWDLTLKRKEGEVSGTITDSASGRPLKAQINISGSQTLQIESKAESGQYKVILKPGNYQLIFTSPGYLPANGSFSLKDKQQQKLDIRMSGKGGSASGKWQIRLGGGVTKVMGGVIPEAAYGYMVRGGGSMEINKNILVGLSVGYGSNKLRGIVWDPNYELYQTTYIDVELDARYRFAFWERIKPYVMIGAGILSWQNVYDGAVYVDPISGEEQKAASPMFCGGAGIEYSIADKIFLWGQGRGGMFLSGDKITTGFLVKDNLLAEGSFGAGYRF
jgi:opacity protein-like surface antigen